MANESEFILTYKKKVHVLDFILKKLCRVIVFDNKNEKFAFENIKKEIL